MELYIIESLLYSSLLNKGLQHPVEMANGEARSRCKYTEEVEAMSETNPLHQHKLEWELPCQML